jgi:hypothetical protein
VVDVKATKVADANYSCDKHLAQTELRRFDNRALAQNGEDTVFQLLAQIGRVLPYDVIVLARVEVEIFDRAFPPSRSAGSNNSGFAGIYAGVVLKTKYNDFSNH